MVGGSYTCSISEYKIERQANPDRTISNLSIRSTALFGRCKSLWQQRSLVRDDALVHYLKAFILRLSTSEWNQRGFGSQVHL